MAPGLVTMVYEQERRWVSEMLIQASQLRLLARQIEQGARLFREVEPYCFLVAVLRGTEHIKTAWFAISVDLLSMTKP